MVKQLPAVGLFSIILMVTPNGLCDVQVPNASFEEGEKFPGAWTLKDGIGTWENTGHSGKRCISLSGDGLCCPRWTSESFTLEPNKFYRLSLWMKTVGGVVVSIRVRCGGTRSGPEVGVRHPEWKRYDFYFDTPEKTKSSSLHLYTYFGQGRVFFDDVTITEVRPVYRKKAGIELGTEERIKDNLYIAGFGKEYGGENPTVIRGGPGSRYLFKVPEALYCGGRWYVERGGIIFRHKVGQVEQTEATFRFLFTYRPAGTPIVLASNDGKNFVELGRERELKKWSDTFQLPAKLFPAKEIYIWLRCDETPEDKGWHTYELFGYEYKSKVANPIPDLEGKTEFVEVGK